MAQLLEGEASEAAAAAKAIRELSLDEVVREELREAGLIKKMLKILNSEENALEIATSLLHFLHEGYFIEDFKKDSAVQELYTSLCRTEERQMVREVLKCLEILGGKHALWPKLDLRDVQKLLVFQFDVTDFLFSYLQHSEDAEEVLMDMNLQPLRRLLKERQAAQAAGVIAVLDQHSCCHCGFGRRHLLKCSRCKAVLYCSRSCQRLDWPMHKSTCGPCAF